MVRLTDEEFDPVDDDVVHDVAVVGAGAVGMVLACLLAARGLDVVVLERRAAEPSIEGPSRAIGIHPPGLRVLDRAGVGDAVREMARVVESGRVISEGRLLGAMRFSDRDPVLTLPQRVTERLLADRLDSLPTAMVRRGRRVTGLRDRGWYVELETRAVDGAVAEPSTVAARYVVGADGVRSDIRALLGIGWRSRPGRGQYVMCDTRDDPVAAETATLYFEPTGLVESFPLPGGGRRVVASLRRDPGAMSVERMATIVRARTGTRFEADAAGEPSVFDARQHIADRFASGRVALAGDAAHELSPVGGLGMNLGWIDALHLDRTIAQALAAGAPHDPFVSYAASRRRAAMRAQWQAAFNMTMGRPMSGASLAARNALVRTLGTRPLRGLVADAFTMRWL